jgi:hypothetical protein
MSVGKFDFAFPFAGMAAIDDRSRTKARAVEVGCAEAIKCTTANFLARGTCNTGKNWNGGQPGCRNDYQNEIGKFALSH